MFFNQLTDKIKNVLSFNWLQHAYLHVNRLALGFDQDGIIAVQTQCAEDGALAIKHCDYFPYTDNNTLKTGLNKLVEKYQLFGNNCSWILLPDQYQLLKVDAADVPDEELVSATRWQIKDMLDMPINDVAIDVFPIPHHGIDKQRKIYVIAAKAHYLQQRIEDMQETGLYPQTIGITELALQNIVNYFSEENKPIALITLDKPLSKIIIYHQQQIHLIRQIDLHQNEHKINHLRNKILLEIERSFDHCQNKLGLISPVKLLLTPQFHPHSDILSFLTEQLKIPVEIIDLQKIMHCPKSLNLMQQAKYLATIGGTLVTDYVYKSTNGRVEYAEC